ncbi:MAG: hypothetical protein ACR652_24380 [Methylocystis sp.]|uniref:hypothetical protein n=1 Tax=Methylocystis sp. TaxID=1911079 RepID=UPI003DA1F54B
MSIPVRMNGKNLTLQPRKAEGILDANGVVTQKSIFTSVDLENLASIMVYVTKNASEAGHEEDAEQISAVLNDIMIRMGKLLPPWELEKVKLIAEGGG